MAQVLISDNVLRPSHPKTSLQNCVTHHFGNDLPAAKERLNDLPAAKERLNDLPAAKERLNDLPVTKERLSSHVG